MRAKLFDKTVIIDGVPREVYGLASFRTSPKRIGIGKWCLKAFEEIARKNEKYCLVGFCDDRTLPFYLKSNYHYCGKYENQNIFTSIPVQSIAVTEKW